MRDEKDKVAQSLRHAARDTALTSLARDAAHDLKGVLNIIAMNVELLSRVARDPNGHPAAATQAERCTEVLQRKLRYLDRSIELILGSRAADAERPEPCDLREICERLVELVAGRAARQAVEVSLTAPAATPVTGYPGRLQAALLALLVNALEAMPRGGRLAVVVSGMPPSVRIGDSGPGIAPDRLADIWRLHYSTKAGGTGLGLPVARAIVESHGGTLSYHPNAEGGSSFVVELPAPETC
jgi:signal transduction histidine kinase